jgi:tetratricopeptide (TPR) repeat protein
VTLTATFKKGVQTAIQAFNLKVLAETVDVDIALLAADKAALSDDSIKGGNPDLLHVSAPLASLPATGSVNGSIIAWSSSNPEVLSNDGRKVVRPVFGALNAPVTLTATFKKGVQTAIQAFNLKVLAETVDVDIALLAADKAALSDDSIKGGNPDLLHVSAPLAPLPATGSVNGSIIAWSSSNPEVLSNDGRKVVRPVFGALNAPVTLTATFKKGAQTATQAFSLKVLAETVDPDIVLLAADKAALAKEVPSPLKNLVITAKYGKAVEIAKSGKYAEASAQLKELIDETGDRCEIYYEYIVVLSQNSQYKEAIKAFDEISARESIPNHVLSAVSKCYDQTGNQEGKSLISKRLELSKPQDGENVIRAAEEPQNLSENSEALRNKRTDIYVQALSMTKNYGEIGKVLLREIGLTDGGNTFRLILLAQYAVENGLTELAVKAYEKVLEHDPENLTAKRNIGMILFSIRKYEVALKLFREYNIKTGGDYITNYNQAELMYIMRKKLQPEKAEPYFEKALDEASQMGGIKGAEIICAKSLYRLNKLKESFAAFDKLEETYPDDIFILADYARMLYDAELLGEAFRKLQKLPDDIYDPDFFKRYNLDKRQIDDITVRVATIRIAYRLSEKRYFTVKKMHEELQAHYPDQPDAALSRSAYYAAFENWRAELESDKEAQIYYPEDETLAAEIERLERAHGSYIKNEFGVRLSDNNGVELLDKTELEFRITGDLRLGINYTVDVANLHDVPRMDGSVKDYRGVRTQAEVFLQGDFINGDTAKISFFDQDGIAGVGGKYTLLDYWGNTSLKGAWREPYWGQQQAIAEKGSNTYLQLGRVYKPFDSLTLSGYVSANSYGLKEYQDLARSISIGTNVEYKLPQIELQRKWLGDLSVFSLNYGLYYEDFFDHKHNSDGTRKYNPSNSQVHSFYVGYTNQFTENFRGSLSAGYAYDAIGGISSSGPIYNASLYYMVTKKLELSTTVGQVISSNKYFYAGIGLKYYFMPETLVEYFSGNK